MNETTAAVTDREQETAFARIREELIGACFSTAKELRHMAERCGFSFVPVEVVQAGEMQVQMTLKLNELAEIHVFADRSQHWHPFYIRTVERAAAT